MGRFASTVEFYARARQPYGAAFFAAVAERLDLNRTQRLLDLGTGPGLLALGFAPFCAEVTGVDPEPAMIEAARRAAQRLGIALALIESRAEDLPENIGKFDVVTIGRALHWMEPEATCAALERVVAPEGHILICRPSTASDDRNPWLSAYDEVRKRWTAPRAGRHSVDLDAFFAGTLFHRQEPLGIELSQVIPIERLVERVLSMSTSSADQLGDDKEQMAAAVRQATSPFAVDGLIQEIVEVRVEIFARVPPASGVLR